jgi:hypothetical protein
MFSWGLIMTSYFAAAGQYITRLGDRIVANWERSSCKWPGGLCYQVAYARARLASQQVGDVSPLIQWDKERMFCTLWGSHYYLPKWRQLPDFYRGKGAPGAMVWDGRASELLEAGRIWSGALRPGAVIQTWKDYNDYIRVLNGEKPRGIGHSFFLHRYVYDGSGISGMKVIDQGYHGGDTVKRGYWGYWVAANVRCLGPSDTYSQPDVWPPALPREEKW